MSTGGGIHAEIAYSMHIALVMLGRTKQIWLLLLASPMGAAAAALTLRHSVLSTPCHT